MKKIFILCVCLFVTCFCYSACVDTLVIHSSVMNKDVKNVVILPDDYYSKKKCSFPVLYLLHGAGGCYSNWIIRVPDIQHYSDMYNIIIICPDGGKTSWYFDSPVDSSCRYETYISQELVTNIDHNYKTIKDKKGRAICGLSMGGHGALYLALKHQDVWGAAGSMSGLFDLSLFSDRWDLIKRLGDVKNDSANWYNNSVIHLINLLENSTLNIFFECGSSDAFYNSNIGLHEALDSMNFQHDFIIHDGNHNWEYWQKAIEYQFLYIYNFFCTTKIYSKECYICK